MTLRPEEDFNTLPPSQDPEPDEGQRLPPRRAWDVLRNLGHRADHRRQHRRLGRADRHDQDRGSGGNRAAVADHHRLRDQGLRADRTGAVHDQQGGVDPGGDGSGPRTSARRQLAGLVLARDDDRQHGATRRHRRRCRAGPGDLVPDHRRLRLRHPDALEQRADAIRSLGRGRTERRGGAGETLARRTEAGPPRSRNCRSGARGSRRRGNPPPGTRSKEREDRRSDDLGRSHLRVDHRCHHGVHALLGPLQPDSESLDGAGRRIHVHHAGERRLAADDEGLLDFVSAILARALVQPAVPRVGHRSRGHRARGVRDHRRRGDRADCLSVLVSGKRICPLHGTGRRQRSLAAAGAAGST